MKKNLSYQLFDENNKGHVDGLTISLHTYYTEILKKTLESSKEEVFASIMGHKCKIGLLFELDACIGFVLYDDDTKFGTLEKILDKLEDSIYIAEFYIAKAYRNKNYGKYLYDQFKKSVNSKTISLSAAQAVGMFWEKLGFKRTNLLNEKSGVIYIAK